MLHMMGVSMDDLLSVSKSVFTEKRFRLLAWRAARRDERVKNEARFDSEMRNRP